MPTHFQKFVKRMNTKASDLGMPDEDLLAVVNAEYDPVLGGLKKSKGFSQVGDRMSTFSSVLIDTDGEWDSGTHTNTEAINNILQMEGGVIQQEEHDSSIQVFGDNWAAQSFVATGTTISKISLLLDKILGSSLQEYDSFNDDSFNTSKWTSSSDVGFVEETGGKLRMYLKKSGNLGVGSVNTQGKASGSSIKGFKCDYQFVASGHSDNRDHWVEITNGTDYIRMYGSESTWQIRLGGSYGSGAVFTQLLSSGIVEVKEEGSDIKIYFNGTLKYTITGKSIAANSYFRCRASYQDFDDGIGDGDTQYIQLDNVYFYQDTVALTDLDIRIEGDSSSAPDGSAISNGTTSIDDANVMEGSASFVEGTFTVNPTVTPGTTYWIVIKQTGGDSGNYYRVYKDTGQPYADGIASTSDDAGTAWSSDSSDLAFLVYQNFFTSGSWLSGTQRLSSGQTLEQIKLQVQDLSGISYISQIDITDSSGVVQSSYTTDITSGTTITLRASDFSSGFSATLDTDFKVKITFSSTGVTSPGVKSVALDTPETDIIELSPLYQGKSGTKTLMAVIAGTIKRLSSGQWVDVKTNLTSGLDAGSVIYRASKKDVEDSGTAESGDLSSLTDSNLGTEPAVNQYQGYFIKITGGTGKGQIRVIQSHTGTTSSTSTTTSTSSSTTTSTTTTSSSTSTSSSTTTTTSTT